MLLLLICVAFAAVTGASLGWTLRGQRPCGTCIDRAEAEAALEAIRREPETLERLKGMKVDRAAMQARVDAANAALLEAGLREPFRVGVCGWLDHPKGGWQIVQFVDGKTWDLDLACRTLPEVLAEYEKRLRARNADLRKAGIDAP